MMRKHYAKDMQKASLWMTRREYAKLIALSGNYSIDSFIMDVLRKNIFTAEQIESQKEEVTSGLTPLDKDSPTAASTAVVNDDLFRADDSTSSQNTTSPERATQEQASLGA